MYRFLPNGTVLFYDQQSESEPADTQDGFPYQYKFTPNAEGEYEGTISKKMKEVSANFASPEDESLFAKQQAFHFFQEILPEVEEKRAFKHLIAERLSVADDRRDDAGYVREVRERIQERLSSSLRQTPLRIDVKPATPWQRDWRNRNEYYEFEDLDPRTLITNNLDSMAEAVLNQETVAYHDEGEHRYYAEEYTNPSTFYLQPSGEILVYNPNLSARAADSFSGFQYHIALLPNLKGYNGGHTLRVGTETRKDPELAKLSDEEIKEYFISDIARAQDLANIIEDKAFERQQAAIAAS